MCCLIVGCVCVAMFVRYGVLICDVLLRGELIVACCCSLLDLLFGLLRCADAFLHWC